MDFVGEFSSNSIHGETTVKFEYPITSSHSVDFLPSLKQVFLRALHPTGTGIQITDEKLLAEAFEWLKENVRAGHWKVVGEYEKIVCQTRDGVEVMVDGKGVRWSVFVRFLRDADAVAFRLRFA
ncbi:MAG: hypothetical protein QHC89_07055 [Bosea sp. (in: a-proteobacteria)]|nr:hypothetical protein [Bosea sp. (in: a-proteobacteria)]